MSLRPTSPGWFEPGDEFHEAVETLILVLQEECRQYRRFVRVVRRKNTLLASGAWSELDGTLRAEKEVLADCVTIERDRLAMLHSLGESLGRGEAHRPRIAELVGHTTPESRDELLDLRDEMRDLADELEGLARCGSFSRHISGNMRLYLREPESASECAEARERIGLTSVVSPGREDG